RFRSVREQLVVSEAYLGLLGRSVQQSGFNMWINFLNAGHSVAQMGDQIISGSEFQSLQGFNDIFLSDIQAHQIKPPVSDLNRLEEFNPKTGAFDTSVAAGSITGLTADQKPANVYFIAHGWAPGFAEDVALHSTPGKPLTWWDTLQFPAGIET